MTTFVANTGTHRRVPQARPHGLLLQAELVVGNATIMFGERKPGWPFTPSLLQVYVDDVEATLDVARQLGAIVVTEPTAFFGDTFSGSVTRGQPVVGLPSRRPGRGRRGERGLDRRRR
jgi:PhnB protein